MSLDYTQDHKNYDHFIGSVVRGHNYEVLGVVVEIEYAVDHWKHHNAFAILDNGRRISCQSFGRNY